MSKSLEKRIKRVKKDGKLLTTSLFAGAGVTSYIIGRTCANEANTKVSENNQKLAIQIDSIQNDPNLSDEEKANQIKKLKEKTKISNNLVYGHELLLSWISAIGLGTLFGLGAKRVRDEVNKTVEYLESKDTAAKE